MGEMIEEDAKRSQIRFMRKMRQKGEDEEENPLSEEDEEEMPEEAERFLFDEEDEEAIEDEEEPAPQPEEVDEMDHMEDVEPEVAERGYGGDAGAKRWNRKN